jgi:hypothetical protein
MTSGHLEKHPRGMASSTLKLNTTSTRVQTSASIMSWTEPSGSIPLLGCLLCKRSGSCRSVVSEYSPNMWYRSAPRKLPNSHARVGSVSPFLPTQCVPIARSQRQPSNTAAPLRLAPLLVSRYPPPQVPPPSFVLLAMRGT